MSRYSANERILRSCLGRDITIHLTAGEEDRVRAYMDRVNHEPGVDEPYRFEEDVYDDELRVALGALLDRALEESEREHGLVGALWGELVSREVADEESRKRRARGVMDRLDKWLQSGRLDNWLQSGWPPGWARVYGFMIVLPAIIIIAVKLALDLAH